MEGFHARSQQRRIYKNKCGIFSGRTIDENVPEEAVGLRSCVDGARYGKGKLASFQKEFLEEVSREPVLLLLEADGAKHFPVKAPAEHEPVICEKTGIVLNVYGMRAIGKR